MRNTDRKGAHVLVRASILEYFTLKAAAVRAEIKPRPKPKKRPKNG